MYRYLAVANSRGSKPSVIRAMRGFKTAKSPNVPERGQTSFFEFNEESNADAMLSSFIEALKIKEAKSATPRSQIPTFDDMMEKKIATSQDMRLSMFSKDIVTTYNLFTVCLRSKELDRAHSLLSSMYALIKTQRIKTPMIDAFNSYFLTWTQTEDLTVDQITHWFSESLSKFQHISFDDRTYAILIDSIMTRSKTPQHHTLVRMYQENCKKEDLKDLLRHADIFKTENLRVLVKDFKIPKEYLPAELQEFFETEEETLSKREAQTAKIAREFSFDMNDIPELRKDSATLASVDTFGLRVIRHSIMALASKNKSEILEKFAKNLKSTTPIDKNEAGKQHEDVDFFSIYKSLSKEDQETFDAVLEEFNYDRQLHVETKGLDSAREKWRHDYEALQKANVAASHKHLNEFLYLWQQELTKLIEEEVSICKDLIESESSSGKLFSTSRKSSRVRHSYAPFLTLVSPEKMSVITIMELLKTDSSEHSHLSGIRTARAFVSVGEAIETEFNSQEQLNSTADKLARARLRKFFKTGQNKARIYLKSRPKAERNLDDPSLGWTNDIKAKVGSLLISLLLRVAKIPITATDPATKKQVQGNVPAFYHSFQYLSGSKVGVIKLQPEFAAKLAKEDMASVIAPQGLPMLVKPRPWTSYRNGGYLTTKSLIQRSKNSAEQTAYMRAASDAGRLDQVFAGLNVLGNTAWTVNKKMFKIIAQVWNTNETFLDVPGVVTAPVYPERPPRSSPPETLRNWKQDVQRISNEYGKSRSMRCDTNYKLEIARAFLGEKFYFPHNLDFRGRAYPLSPHFNHLGNDLSRSLLIFWEGKELGPTGLNWLKVHISNLFGIDKVSLAERQKFADDNYEKFKKCCEDPFSEEGSFWQSADKPWQALATIHELVEAMEMDDPTKFVSHQPVHQDGTCNGLQHYAALGGDIPGATQVNLVPQDKPADVYSFVAKLVQKRVDRDVEKGVEEAIKIQHQIKRKVVKQTVMTSVYGVTFVGARDQIAKQLEVHYPDRLELSEVSRYLTKQVFDSIRELFEGAHLIQDWLAEAARIISRSFNLYSDDTKTAAVEKPELITSVVWTTPLGLPIVQPYRSITKRQIQTNLQTVYISDPFLITPVDSKKQRTALPPNYIHSLDATHMLKSSIRCGEEDMAFAAVHDSYWTNACNVEIMNKHLRNEFVDLYQDDLIKNLKDEFETRYADFLQVVSIPRKSQLAQEVIALRKQLSEMTKRNITFYDEMYIEAERRKLLASDKPEEVQAGKEMVTTISLMASHMNSPDVKTPGVFGSIQALAPVILPEIPPKGGLDINCVKDSLYFFS